jgi:predicted exporter
MKQGNGQPGAGAGNVATAGEADRLRQKRLARVIIAVSLVAALAWLAHLNYRQKISTDVLDLVPNDERSPELSLVRTLASADQAREVLLAVRAPVRPGEAAAGRDRRSERAAQALAESLTASPAFAEVRLLSDPAARNALGLAVFTHRFDLLLPAWLEAQARLHAAIAPQADWPAWLAERSAAELEAFLTRPEAVAFQPLLPADPLLLVPGLLQRMPGFADGGAATGLGQGYALVWARAREAPLREEGQGPVFAAVARAEAAAGAVAPGLELRWTGIARFAAASRASIERELSRLNFLSLAAVLILAAICVRRLHRALHLAPVVIGSILGAWVAVTAAWDRVHVLVFVVGSLLAGVAVDYGFYLYLQPRRTPDETYREKAGRLLKPLLASALTTVLGFSLLLWSDLPLLRQLGVFVSAGLVSALAAALVWFAQVQDPYLETRPWVRRRSRHPSRGLRLAARALLVTGAAIALLGPGRLRWRDDIRELEPPAPELAVNDRAVRALFGESDGTTVYLTRGTNPAEARAALDRFLAWHERMFPDAATATLGYALPTEEAWRRLPGEVAGLNDFPTALRGALARHGFDPSAFQPFFTAWTQWRRAPVRPDYAALTADLGAALQGPLSILFQTGPGYAWFATIARHPAGAEPPASTATASAAQLQTLNRLFSRYRVSALRLSALGLGLLAASVVVLYGWRRGPRIFALPVGACLFAFGVFGLTGVTLNLFHLLGAFLGVCLSHNYAIFFAENSLRHEEPPPSIRLSAAAAAASFGVLALSRIPVVAALGSTVALIVVTALAMTELLPLARLRSADAADPW